jgi:hypothetical protein
VIDYAKRRSVSTEVAMKWLNPNIAGTLRETRKVMINNPDDLFQNSLRGLGMTYESNKSHRNAKGETLFSFEIIPPQRESIQDLYDNIDPLMEFKPPFIDVTT